MNVNIEEKIENVAMYILYVLGIIHIMIAAVAIFIASKELYKYFAM